MKIKTSKKIIILIAAVIVALGLSGFFAFQLLFSGNTAFDEKSRIVLIEQETEVQKLADLLIEQGIIDQASGFVLTSKFKRFKSSRTEDQFCGPNPDADP